MESTLRHISRIILSPSFISPSTSGLGSNNTSPPINEDLLKVLFGLKEPSIIDIPKASTSALPLVAPNGSAKTSENRNKAGDEDEEIAYFDDTLNDSQKEAVRFVLKAGEVGCIHGPPGVSLASGILVTEW